ncbi:unnamed protein product [Trifolium pratense]|uniref:Uncharacterized protein n=1 Tax=Trifolium pratense TaxID=57577 RepID=A0ACB0LWU9_TRIPR|nr:unnamed protein product [Trifolium pratense]
MENSMGLECMVVFFVSGGMFLLVQLLHKHFFNNFMKKFVYEIWGVLYPHHPKHLNGLWKNPTKKVRFAEHVLELPKEKGDFEI